MADTPLNGEIVQFHDYTPSAQIARQMHNKVTWLVSEINDKGTQLGCLLYQIEEDGLFRQLGHETFGAYIASPDVHLSRSQVFKLMALAKASSPELLRPRPENAAKLPQQPLFSREDVAAMGIERAYMVLPIIRREPDKAQDWVATAKTLGPTDLALAIREQQDPSFTPLQEAAFELGRKLAGMAYHLRETHSDPLAILDELIAAAEHGRDWILTLMANNRAAEEWEQIDEADRAGPGTGNHDGRASGDEGISGTGRGDEPVDGARPSDALDQPVP